MNTRILSITLVLAMLVGMFTIVPMTVSADTNSNVWDGTTATSFAGGDGTESNPYQISNGAELALMSAKINAGEGLNACYKLTADIYLNVGDAEDFEANNARIFTPMGIWTPKGTAPVQASFGGTFDGDGHIISGLYQNGEGNQGLFGNISGGATFKNFALVNSYIKTSGDETGAIAGQSDRNSSDAITFSNIYTDAIVIGKQKIAGIIGNVSGVSSTDFPWFESAPEIIMESVVFNGKVNSSSNHSAGLIGYSSTATLTFTDCMNIGVITTGANDYAAGLVGRHESASIEMTNCISAGTIAAKGVSSSNKMRCAIFAASSKKGTTTLDECLYVSNVLSCSLYDKKNCF